MQSHARRFDDGVGGRQAFHQRDGYAVSKQEPCENRIAQQTCEPFDGAYLLPSSNGLHQSADRSVIHGFINRVGFVCLAINF